VAVEHAHADRDHVVQFYESDADLAEMVVAYLVAAVAAQDAVVAIATPDHLEAFASGLAASGVDVDAAIRTGAVVTLDAAEALGRFMVDGMPDPVAFDAVVGGAIRALGSADRPVRAYGEMVALLWAEDNVAGALELERLWNDLGAHLPFSLFCAYPADLVADPDRAAALAQVCHLHSEVLDASPSRLPLAVSQRFARSPRSPREAREFVTATLRRWSCDHLVDRCQVIVSELATNAVRHAATSFGVSLSRVGLGAVQVAVADASSTPPRPRTPDPGRPGGRGMHLVAALSARWGHEPSSDGKLVWAVVGELP
jgi:anti-sigma regulatory factor (Ser/Thr protein kinase)